MAARPSAAKDRVAPKNLQVGGHFTGIIDIYDDNDHVSLDEAWRLGVRAILHETGMGLYKKDKAYRTRKAAALAKGFLWGAFHLVSAEPADDQLDRFLSIEDGKDGHTAMALDWEPTSHGMMAYPTIKALAAKFNDRLGYYPIVYCDARVGNVPGIVKGDQVLSKCPLWFARPTKHPDQLGIPKATWPNYTLWQFDDEKRHYDAPYPAPVLPGADWNSFKGTVAELERAWPFRRSTG